MKCLEEFPISSVMLIKLKKLKDLLRNHKFWGGLLGIILIVTTDSIKITTAKECTSSGNTLPLLVHIITTAVRITFKKLI
jgi:hypothetical protein